MELTFFLKGLALLFGFYMAWNIGANDVANAMGTSVGSKALTLKKAIFLAALLEFSGAFFFGSNVSKTIQNGILSPDMYVLEPQVLVLGMLAVLLSTGLLLQVASYLSLPVSTTHAIVGSVLGFGLLTRGSTAIQWKSVSMICSSWVLSPFLSGALGFLVYYAIEKLVLYPAYAGDGGATYFRKQRFFVTLQIVSACFVAFAHGANDVSNAVGPVAAIFSVFDPTLEGKIPYWLLAFGGVSIIIGLATWGFRVIETVGKKITELSPAKGFAAEFSTAFVVLFASKVGLPISTTHALVGSVFGVGLVQGAQSLNLTVFKGILVSWITTLPLCAVVSSLVYQLLELALR